MRSDFEVTCFAYEGIDAIKAALMKGIESGYGLERERVLRERQSIL